MRFGIAFLMILLVPDVVFVARPNRRSMPLGACTRQLDGPAIHGREMAPRLGCSGARPSAPATIDWLSWHRIWWWSGLLAAIRNETQATREDVIWPGSAEAAGQRLETLSTEWAAVLSSLDDCDLERPLAYPWSETRPLRLGLAWAIIELMKNIVEIEYIRHLFQASHRAG